MARFTEKFWAGRWWKRDEWDAMVATQRALQPKGPTVIRDTLGEGVRGVWNPVDGQTYDSRRAYEKAVTRAGCVIMGNEAPAHRPEPSFAPAVTGRDIKQAIEQLS